MTSIRNALNHGTASLGTHHEGVIFESELLLAHVLEKSRTYLHTWPERALTHAQHAAFNQLIERRVKGEPCAYIIGEREFWSLTLEVTPDTLIPRPETERLVELALERIPLTEPINIADLGTGSGAIALALACERPHCHIIATDFSADALTVAERNRKKYALENVSFRQGDWLTPLNELTFQLIAANPPYIREDDSHLNQGDLPFEPRSALVAADHGLDDIRCIIANSRERLAANGWLLIEHGYDQADDVTQLFTQHGYHNITAHHDLSRQPRVVCGQHL